MKTGTYSEPTTAAAAAKTRAASARHFYGIVTTRTGYGYYIGPYSNRSTARRAANRKAAELQKTGDL